MKFKKGDIVRVNSSYTEKFNGQMGVVKRYIQDPTGVPIVIFVLVRTNVELWYFEEDLELKTQQDLDNWILEQELTE